LIPCRRFRPSRTATAEGKPAHFGAVSSITRGQQGAASHLRHRFKAGIALPPRLTGVSSGYIASMNGAFIRRSMSRGTDGTVSRHQRVTRPRLRLATSRRWANPTGHDAVSSATSKLPHIALQQSQVAWWLKHAPDWHGSDRRISPITSVPNRTATALLGDPTDQARSGAPHGPPAGWTGWNGPDVRSRVRTQRRRYGRFCTPLRHRCDPPVDRFAMSG
jgi:hypothetical protein